MRKLCDRIDEIFDGYANVFCVSCRDSIAGAKTHDLDFDGTGGCTFLRVLLSLIIHDYPQLVVGALKLLLKHFSQRQEVLQAFKQVSSIIWAVLCIICVYSYILWMLELAGMTSTFNLPEPRTHATV